MRKHYISSVAFFCLLAIALVGCGDGKDAVYPVTGKFTINGTVMKDVTLTLVPAKAGGEVATALVGDDGTFQMFTGVAGRPGAEPGSYKVVLKFNPPMSAENYGAKPNAQNSQPAAVASPFPAEYAKAETSPKSFDVKSGKNELILEITK